MLKNFNYELISKYVNYSLIILLIWASVWSLDEKDATPPNGFLFNLLVLFVISYLSGELTKLIYLPPLLGMLITGIIFAICLFK